MNKKKRILFSLIITLISMLSTSLSIAAANFNIVPAAGYPWPTKIHSGGAVSAFYTVTNQTSSTRSGYQIQGLPASVTQNSSKPGYCSNPIILQAHANCTLQLDITAPIQSGFAICKGIGCTTAAVPLNVVKAELYTYAYVGDFSSTLWKCPMDSTGSIINKMCIALKNTTPPNFVSTTGATFADFLGTTYAYVSDFSSNLWQCPVDMTEGSTNNSCTALTNTTSPNFFTTEIFVKFATFSGVTYAYVGDGSPNLWQCPMSAIGDINNSACTALTNVTPPHFNRTQGITFASFSGVTYGYVLDGSHNIWQCPMNTTGGISGGVCTALTNATSPNFVFTEGVTFASFSGTTYSYVSDYSHHIWQCPMNATGGISGSACTPLTNAPNFINTQGMTFASFSGTTYGYVSDNSSTLWQCPMNETGKFIGGACAALTNVTSSGFKQTTSVTFHIP